MSAKPNSAAASVPTGRRGRAERRARRSSSANTSGIASTPCCLLATANPSASPAAKERCARAAQAPPNSHRVSQGSVKAVGENRIAKGETARSKVASAAVLPPLLACYGLARRAYGGEEASSASRLA